MSGVVQVLSSGTNLMPMDDRPTRYNHSCLFDLNDSYGQIGVGSIFNSQSVAPLSKGHPECYRIYCCSLDVPLY